MKWVVGIILAVAVAVAGLYLVFRLTAKSATVTPSAPQLPGAKPPVAGAANPDIRNTVAIVGAVGGLVDTLDTLGVF